MPLTGIRWDIGRGGGRDIHVVRDLAGARNQTSRPLAELLVLDLEGANPKWASETPLPAGVTAVSFQPVFNYTLLAHGHAVNANSGVVTVAAQLPPGAVEVPNFIVKASVTHTNPALASPQEVAIRVHIHNAVVKVWLTPDPLTVRIGARGNRFSVFAEFDDGVVGDISCHPGLAWSVVGPGLVSADGIITPLVPDSEFEVTVTLPPDLGPPPITASAKVRAKAAWPLGLTAQLAPGSPGWRYRNEVPNVLFLAEGFLPGERAAFEKLVHRIVNKIAHTPTVFPFNLLSTRINFWSLFLESRERGASVVNGLSYRNRTAGKLQMVPLPKPEAPGAAGIQTLNHLIYQVGLPLPGVSPADEANTTNNWIRIYGNAHVQGLNPPLFSQWCGLAGHTLAFEQDTALGLSTGINRPQVNRADDGRIVGWHPYRVTRTDIDGMLASLKASDSGQAIGDLWSRGKDRLLVFALVAGARFAGTRHPEPAPLIASSLIETTEIQVAAVAGGNVVRTKPYPIPRSLPVSLIGRVVHETAHALKLGDEYAGNPQLATPQTVAESEYWNLQLESGVKNPDGRLNGGLIRWNWPRMAKVGVLLEMTPPAPPMAVFRFRIRVRPGLEPGVPGGPAPHGTQFAIGEQVRLRRPLSLPPKPAAFFVVAGLEPGPAMDQLILTVHYTGPDVPTPADYPAGSLVYLPTRHPTHGSELTLVWDDIRNHITLTSSPLNRLFPAACTADKSNPQFPINRPAALPAGKPPYVSWLVGLYDGGATHDCGVFHPAGACMMRQNNEIELRDRPRRGSPPKVTYRFCAVCRYILVDQIEPTLHPLVDAEYTKFYPIP